MKRHLLGLIALLSLVPSAIGQGASVTETIRIKYLEAKTVPAVVTTLQGIEQVVCDFNSNSVTVRGSQQAVDAFKAEVQKADVPPIIYRVEMRLVRLHVDAPGNRKEDVVMKPIIHSLDKSPAFLSLKNGQSGFAVQVTPTRDTDKAVTLAVEVQEIGEQGEIIQAGKNARRVTLGETVRITGMTDTTDKALRRAVQQGEVVTTKGEYTALYLEVKPTVPLPNQTANP